jgi:hypothetical protein
VAKLCRKLCGETRLLISAICAAARQARWAHGHRLCRIADWEQPTLWPRRLPPSAQQVEQVWGEHDVTILAAFALLDADDHALAVDVGDLERDHLSGA